MKKIIGIIIFLGLLLTVNAIESDTNLLGNWRMNSSRTTLDYTSYNNHLTNNGVTFVADNAQLNGSTWLDTPLGQTANFTWSAWFKYNTTGTFQNIMSITKTGNPDYRIALQKNNADQITINYDDNVETGIATGSSISTGTWYHVILTKSGENWVLYLNGISNATASTTSFNMSELTADVDIGRYPTGSSYFIGDMKNATIWDRALNSSEALDLYQNGIPVTEYQITMNGLSFFDEFNIGQNELNFTVTDVNLFNLSYNINGGTNISVQNNTNLSSFTYTPTSREPVNVNIYVNGELNPYTFNPYHYFSFNDTSVPELLSNYTFGGKTETGTYINFTAYDSQLAIGNNTLTFNKGNFPLTNFTATVSNTSGQNTTYQITPTNITLTIKDKDTFATISGPQFDIEFEGPVGLAGNTTTGVYTTTGILSDGDYVVRISHADYETESLFFTFDSQTDLELVAYMINSSDVNLGFVIVQAKGESSQVLSNVIVQARQWDVSSSSYITVSEDRTGTNGQGTLNIILNDKSYIFRAVRDSQTVESPSETITSDENGKTIPLSFETAKGAFQYELGKYNGNASESFNNVTNISTITFDYSHDDNIAITACINLYKTLDNIERLIEANCTTSQAGQYIKAYTINTTQYVTIKAEFLIDGTYETVNSFKHEPSNSTSNILISSGLHIFVLLILIGLSIWIGFELMDSIYVTLFGLIFSVATTYNFLPTIMPVTVQVVMTSIICATYWGVYKRK